MLLLILSVNRLQTVSGRFTQGEWPCGNSANNAWNLTSWQSNLTQGRIAAAHGRFSHICEVVLTHTPYIERQKWLPWQRPLVAGYQQYLHIVGRPLNPPPTPITNCLFAIVHTKPVIAILVPKLVAMATTLRHCISAMSYQIAWPRNGTPLYPPKFSHSHGRSGPPSNTWFPGTTRGVLNPKGTSTSSAGFAGLTSVTDHATRSVTTGHIYVLSTVMRPKNIHKIRGNIG